VDIWSDWQTVSEELIDRLPSDINGIICGLLLGNVIKRTSKLFEKCKTIDVYELNRAYCDELKSKNIDLRMSFFYTGVGEKTETIPYERFDGREGRYSYLEYISDDEVKMTALDDIYVDQIDEGKKINIIYMGMENAQISALKGMKKIIKRDRPLLVIKLSNNAFLKEEKLWMIANAISSIDFGYEYVIRGILNMGIVLFAYHEEY
jgi:hypothetical protein